MQLFKIIFFIMILFTQILNAQENQDYESIDKKEEVSNWNYFGELGIYMAKIYKNKEKIVSGKKIDNFDDYMNYNSLQLSIDYLNENFYFSMTPYAYIYITESGDEVKGSNYSTPFKFKDFFFRSLYMSYSVNNLTFGIGVLPLSNSFPMQYTNDYYQDGEGISIISDIDPLAVFMKYRFNEDNRVLVGFGLIDTAFIPSGKYLNKHNVEKSHGIFISQTIQKEKFKIINDFKYTNIFYDNVQSGDFFTLATGLSWDDSEYSGWSFYDVIAGSIYNNNSIAVKDKIIANNSNITTKTISKYPSSFAFDNNTYKGAANLIGFRRDIDIFNIESFLNFEWFHTFGNWTSANKGAPYNSNCNQIANIRNNSYFINFGLRLSELMTMKVNYTYLEFDEIQNIGAPSSTPYKNSFGPQRNYAEVIKLSFSYKF